MDFEEYRKQAARTRPPRRGRSDDRLIQSVMGIGSESGEITGLMEKIFFQGHDFDLSSKTKLKKELGDLMWYLVMLLDEVDIPFGEVMQGNIDKLKTRYPEKFSTEDSVKRTDADYG